VSVQIQCCVIDSANPNSLATFWEKALGWRRTYNKPEQVVLEPPAGSPADGVAPDLVFCRVPDAKTVKNRLHFELRPDDQESEVNRLLSVGARRVDIGQSGPEVTWVVLADPEGNEFCVLGALQEQT